MMDNGRKRILFVAEGATMAHFVRPLVLAQALDPEIYEVHFYAPARFSRFLSNQRFEVGELESIPGEQFLINLAKGAPLFSADVLRRYVQEERNIIKRIRPALIVGDMRQSLSISARLEGTPVALMINAYWSPYSSRRRIIPTVPLTRVVPPRWLGPVYRFSEPFVYALHVRPMNRVRKEFGLPPLGGDLRLMYTDGDFVLYPDIPEFVPTSNLPKTHRYVGICEWNLPIQKPHWWSQAMADKKPKAFVTLGSSGPVEILPELIKALARLPAAVLLSTSGRSLPVSPSTPYVADLLPFMETAAHADVVVSHGGSGGLYPAMAAGTPVLGVPSNADQQLSTAVLCDSGAGLGVRVEDASESKLLRALTKLIGEPEYRQRAQHWRTIYAQYDSGAMFRKFVAEILPVGSG